MQCKNCKTGLSVEDRFCPNCGARVVQEQLTFRYLANDASERFLDFNNNLLLRTFKHMFSQPEAVVDGYINGIRRRYLSAANYVALAITIAGLQFYLIQKFFKDSMDMSWMGQTAENNPMLQDSSFFDSLWEYNSLLYIALIPVYAIISRIVFWNYKKYSYLGHIVVIGYTQSHISVAFFVPTILALMFGMNYLVWSYIMMFFMTLYYSYCYKRMLNLSWGSLILKFMLFSVIAFFALIGFSILLWVYLFASGTVDLQEFMEANKAAQQGSAYIISSAINWTS